MQTNPYESPESAETPPPKPGALQHPPGLYTLFFTEMWERLSYYGMRALLVLFMVDQIERGGMGLTKETASAIYGLYTALVYVVALPGGWVADRLLGAQRSVWYGGWLIAAGHFTLAIPRTEAFFLGLVLIVVGTGLLKPNISVIVGQLYPEGGARRDAGFTIFYMGINLGAMIGPLVCSTLGEKVNWHWGFGAAGVGMLLGLLQYWFMAKHLGEAGKHPVKRKETGGFDYAWLLVIGGMAVLAIIVALGLLRVIVFDPLPLATYSSYGIAGIAAVYLLGILLLGNLSHDEMKRMGILIVLLLACALFWAGFEQAGSSLNLFAKDYTVRDILGFEVPAGWFQSLNPVFIITLSPVMAALWVALSRREKNPSVPAKFGLALVLMGLGFLVMIPASRMVGDDQRVWPTWLIATYLIHTIAELCLSPVGLSAVTKLAPERYVGQLMGLWFLATSLGSLIAGLMASEIETAAEMPSVYLRIVVLGVAAGVLLLICVPLMRKWAGKID
jgi:POT family proton-dependent oligopeptide transporter